MRISFAIYLIIFLGFFAVGFFLTKDIQDIIVEAFGFRIHIQPIAGIVILLLSYLLLYVIIKFFFILLNIPNYLSQSREAKALQKMNENLMLLVFAMQSGMKQNVQKVLRNLKSIQCTPYFECYVRYMLENIFGEKSKLEEKKEALLEMLQYSESTKFALYELCVLMMSEKQYENALIYASKMYELFPDENAAELLVRNHIMLCRWNELDKLLNLSSIGKFLNKVNFNSYRDMVCAKLETMK